MFPLHDDNPTRRTPFVTVGLIAVCALVHLWRIFLDDFEQRHAVFAPGAIPVDLFAPARAWYG